MNILTFEPPIKSLHSIPLCPDDEAAMTEVERLHAELEKTRAGYWNTIQFLLERGIPSSAEREERNRKTMERMAEIDLYLAEHKHEWATK
jgi:hypothetical protein